jgi:hypothetical protein
LSFLDFQKVEDFLLFLVSQMAEWVDDDFLKMGEWVNG